jgi:hypothetical protein
MKNKKLLLTALLCVFIFSDAFAQFRWQSDAVIGQTLANKNTADKDTFSVHFNTSKANSIWLKSKKVVTSDSIVVNKCSTQRGIQCLVYSDGTTTTSVQSRSFKGAAYGANGNPVRVASLDSLLKIMAKSAATVYSTGTTISPTSPTVNGTPADSLTAPAHCLFDVAGSSVNQAFGVYPGKYKHLEYAYQFDFTGKACTDDVTFDIDTYNAGTTGKTASYELAVYSGTTISDANLIGSKITGFYVTGTGKKSVSLAAALGKVPGDFSNKKICVFLRTLGTSNASSTVDGVANASNYATHVPLAYDPIIVFDNFFATYGSASWSVPSGVVASTIFNHNNGSPVNLGLGSIDFTGGTPVSVPAATATSIYFYLTDINRIGALDITEANDGGGHVAAYSFGATGAVMKKAADGTFSVPVTYTYTASDGTTKMDLNIPAPTTGSVNDTLQIALTATVPQSATRSVRLEITNGIRFWYNIGAIGDLGTAVAAANVAGLYIYSANKTIVASNAIENVVVYTITGQKVKVATALQAAQGINVQSGIYVVKSGKTVQKVIVQ